MVKRKKLLKIQKSKLSRVHSDLTSLMDCFKSDDLLLNFGNGSVCGQLSVALAALECIYQEYKF